MGKFQRTLWGFIIVLTVSISAVGQDTGKVSEAPTAVKTSVESTDAAPVEAVKEADTDTGAQGTAVAPTSSVSGGGKPLPEETSAEFDAQVKKIGILRSEIKRVKAQLGTAKGLMKRILRGREDKARVAALTELLAFAKAVADQKDAGYDVATYYEAAKTLISEVPSAVYTAIRRVDRPEAEVTDEKLSAADQAARDLKIEASAKQADAMVKTLIDGLEIQERYDINTESDRKQLEETLLDAAELRSALLQMTIDDITLLNTQVAQLPDDAELKAKLSVTQKFGDIVTDGLSRTVAMMKTLSLDVSRYDAQLVEAIGKITAVALNAKVVKSLFSRWYDVGAKWFEENGISILFQLLLFIVIVFAFWILSRIVEKMMRRLLQSPNINFSRLLNRMIISLSKNLVIIAGVVIALSQVGISVGPLLAGFGVAGFIVGFALQETLSNFASGLMILIYRPFDVGDILEAAGVYGRVNKMSLVNTTVLTLDNQTLVVPNNKIWGDTIRNVTAQDIRRIDMVFGVSYSDDIPHTEKVLREILESCEKTLKDPEPMIRLHELGDSSVNFVVRPWVKTEDYWDVYWEVHRKVKMTFDERGISIPFPQRDVHFFPHAPLSVESTTVGGTKK